MSKKQNARRTSKKINGLKKTFSFLTMLLVVINMSISGMFFIAPDTNATTSSQLCTSPVDVVLVLDRSGSMTDDVLGTCIYYENSVKKTKVDVSYGACVYDLSGSWTPSSSKFIAAKAAAKDFVDLLMSNDQSALISFASTVSLDKGLSSGHEATKSSIDGLVSLGSTNIGDAISFANTELGSSRGNPQAVKIIILLTDGKANLPFGNGTGENPADVSYAEAKALDAAAAGYKIFTIGLGQDVNDTMLQNIASSTNAEYYFAPAPGDLQSIYNTISQRICQYGSISGTKFIDANNDGILIGEIASSDWTINLSGTASSTQKTDLSGKYIFSGLLPGTYTISEAGKIGVNSYLQTYPVSGNPYTITLSEGENITGKDFGNYLATCGNSIIDSGEECDNGLQNGEVCTAGYDATCTYCSLSCQTTQVVGPNCGDNIVNGDEECDGNNISNGTCNATCEITCDSDHHLNETLNCELNTPDPMCGDGNIDTSLGEECDAGSDNGVFCNAAYGESCDYCSISCQIETTNNSSCGDGVVDSTNGEQCDDNNIIDGDGCSDICEWETNQFFCSEKPENSIWQTVSGYEQTCEASDGNTCTSWSPAASSTIYSLTTTSEACHFSCEDGFNWNGSSCVASVPVCGNGLVEDGEECDDGNVVSGDACSASCTIESNGGGGEIIYDWETSGWGTCSATCGGGTQTRTITCVGSDDSIDETEEKCVAETKPGSSQSCNTQSCSSGSTGTYSGGSAAGTPSPFTIRDAQVSAQCINGNVIANVNWSTNYNANSRVVYDTDSYAGAAVGLAPNYNYTNSTISYPTSGTAHSVGISNLAQNSFYYFRPVSVYNSVEDVGEEITLQTPSCVIVLGEEGGPELSITNKVLVPYANPGAKGVEFELTVTNNGDLSSYNTNLKHVLPEGLSFSVTNESQQSWNLGDLAPGETKITRVKTDVAQDANARNYTTQAYTSSDNNAEVNDDSSLEVRMVAVLAETGFNSFEFLGLVSMFLFSLGFRFYLGKKLN